MHVMAPHPVGQLAATRVDARGSLALLALEHRELLLGPPALALDAAELAHRARHRALGLDEGLLRSAALGLGPCHLILQFADALLELVEVGAPLGDLAAGLGKRRTRHAGQGDERGDAGAGEQRVQASG